MPWQGRDIGQFQQGHGGHLALVDQALEDSRREVGEPQLSADMAFGQCRFSFTISLRGFHMISARYLRKWRGFLLCDFNFIMDFNRF